MARKKLEERNIRKIFKHGASNAITLPIEILRDLKWREKQKLVMKKRGQTIIISGWKKE